MFCPNCQTENPTEARFCNQCGRSLAPAVAPANLAIDRMIEDYLRAVDKNPSDALARYNLALAYRLKGLDDRAEAELLRVRDLSPDFADVEYQLALICGHRGDSAGARAAAEKALAIDPEHEAARRLLDHIRGK